MDVSVEPHVPVGDPLTQRAYRDGDEDVPAIFEFDYNSSYQVTITPDDESTASQGYCLVSFMDAEKNLLVYHTQKIAKDGTFTFTYENGIPDGLDPDELADLLAQEDKLTFVAYWGEYIPAAAGFMKAAGREISGMKNGAVIGLPPVQLPVTTTYKLGDHIALEDETLRDGTRCIVLRAAEGYALPETIEVTINKQAYSVYTAGERIDGQPWFDFENSTLFIPGGLLKPGYTRSIMVTIQAEAVAVAVPELLPSPEQREIMYRKIREYRNSKPIFTIDFQHDGEYVKGCIAGGRSYLHINANGDIEPCAFIHYADSNIRKHSLLEAYKRPLFMAYKEGQPFNDNMLRPCPMLENPECLRNMVKCSGACSTDMESPENIDDLYAKCKPYAERWAPKADELWTASRSNQDE